MSLPALTVIIILSPLLAPVMHQLEVLDVPVTNPDVIVAALQKRIKGSWKVLVIKKINETYVVNLELIILDIESHQKQHKVVKCSKCSKYFKTGTFSTHKKHCNAELRRRVTELNSL